MKQPQYLALTIFLLILSICLFLVLSAIIIINRQLRMRQLKNSKLPYTPLGYGMPKIARDSVEQNVDATCTVFVEPKVFTEEYVDKWNQYLSRDDMTFLYRLKVVDMYKGNEDLITLLKNSNSHDKFGNEANELIFQITELYKTARHSYKPFVKEDFEKYSRIHERLFEMCGGRSDIEQLTNTDSQPESTTKKKNSQSSRLSKKSSKAKIIEMPTNETASKVSTSQQIPTSVPSTSRPTSVSVVGVDQRDQRRISVDSIDSMTALIERDKTEFIIDDSMHSINDRLISKSGKHGDDDDDDGVGFSNQGIHSRSGKMKTAV